MKMQGLCIQEFATHFFICVGLWPVCVANCDAVQYWIKYSLLKIHVIGRTNVIITVCEECTNGLLSPFVVIIWGKKRSGKL